MFKDARNKLFEEIDILEIIKKLRVNKFTSEVFLKPRQRDLVNFFDEYKLTDVPPVAPVPKEKKPNTHHSIQSNDSLLDSQPDKRVNVEDLIENDVAKRVITACESIDYDNDKIDKIIYQRIVGEIRDNSSVMDPNQMRYDNRLSAHPLKQNVDDVLFKFGSHVKQKKDSEA